MSTVTSFIKTIKQPYGGYLPIKEFEVTALGGGMIDTIDENIAPQQVGVVVDYLTRFVTGSSALDAFKTALNGAIAYYMFSMSESEAQGLLNCSEEKIALKAFKSTNVWDMIQGLDGLSDSTIITACTLAEYDAIYRSCWGCIHNYEGVGKIIPNTTTISHIREMVSRMESFFNKNGSVVSSGFDFEGAYTLNVSRGDGDFLTKDTLWDCKVFKSEPRSLHTLQLLVYYVLGQHTRRPEFKSIKRLGIYNPRKDKSYTLEVSKISDATIKTIEKCIGYRV